MQFGKPIKGKEQEKKYKCACKGGVRDRDRKRGTETENV